MAGGIAPVGNDPSGIPVSQLDGLDDYTSLANLLERKALREPTKIVDTSAGLVAAFADMVDDDWIHIVGGLEYSLSAGLEVPADLSNIRISSDEHKPAIITSTFAGLIMQAVSANSPGTYNVGAIAVNAFQVTFDTAAEAGNVTEGDMLVFRDGSEGFSAIATADGDPGTGVVTFDATPGILLAAGTTTCLVYDQPIKRILFENLIIRGDGVNTTRGLQCIGCDNLTVRNVRVENTTSQSIFFNKNTNVREMDVECIDGAGGLCYLDDLSNVGRLRIRGKSAGTGYGGSLYKIHNCSDISIDITGLSGGGSYAFFFDYSHRRIIRIASVAQNVVRYDTGAQNLIYLQSAANGISDVGAGNGGSQT